MNDYGLPCDPSGDKAGTENDGWVAAFFVTVSKIKSKPIFSEAVDLDGGEGILFGLMEQ